MTEHHPAPAPASTAAVLTPPREADPRRPGDRSDRRALRAEKAQLTHWRRLLRARLDLAVAAFAPPEPLGTVDWDKLPQAHHDLPDSTTLGAAVAVVTPIDPVELMNRLRHLDRSLAEYGRALDGALEVTTEHVVHDLARHTAAARTAPTGTDGGR
jgi:hypothetical protein